MKLREYAIAAYRSKKSPIPGVFAVGTRKSHYVNVVTGKHGDANANLSEVDDSYKTIDSIFYGSHEDMDHPQPHLQITAMPNTEIQVNPPENLIMNSNEIFKVVPPAVVVLNIQNVAESIINKITYKVS